LGQAHHLTGQFTQAITAQKQALIRDPHFLFSSIWLSWSCVWAWGWQLSQDQQTLDDAFAAAQKAVTLNAASPWAHVVLGRVYLWKRQPEQAITEAERAISLDPHSAVGYGLLAEILNAVGKPEEAIERVEQAIRIGYPYPYVYLLELGQAYCLTGRYEEATTLQQLLAHSPDMLQAHLNLAFAYSALGREEEAQAAVAEVLRISPHFSLAVMRQRVPFTDATVLERYLNGLRKAGLE
jgi:adenylate cyclase